MEKITGGWFAAPPLPIAGHVVLKFPVFLWLKWYNLQKQTLLQIIISLSYIYVGLPSPIIQEKPVVYY
jgi:hypothetical protein